MAIFNYTAAKGVFETADSNSTGAFNVSDVGVVGEAAPAGDVNVQYLRFYDQAHSDGDDYASLDQVSILISAEGVHTTFYLDTNNSADGTGTQIRLDTVNTSNLGGATPTQVATAVATIINGALGTVHCEVQTQVGNANSTADYVDLRIFNRTAGVSFGLATSDGSILPMGTVQSATSAATLRSIDGGAYLAAGRLEDQTDDTLDTGLGGIQLGALSDGTSPGQMICMFNNSTYLRMFFTGNFASGNDTCMIDHGEGSILAWNGTDWIEWKYYGGQASFS